MDEYLFSKHIIKIKQYKNDKEEIISHIKEYTGIQLQESMITLSKKEITFHISSTIKQKFFQKNIHVFLQEKGYSIKN